MPIAKLSSKSQIVLPAQMRKNLDVKPGDLLQLVEKDGAVIIRKAPLSVVEALDACGSEIWRDYADELASARDQWDA